MPDLMDAAQLHADELTEAALAAHARRPHPPGRTHCAQLDCREPIAAERTGQRAAHRIAAVQGSADHAAKRAAGITEQLGGNGGGSAGKEGQRESEADHVLAFPVILHRAATGACLLRTTAILRFIPSHVFYFAWTIFGSVRQVRQRIPRPILPLPFASSW